MKPLSILIIMLLAVLVSNTSQAAFIRNGSFETGNFIQWSINDNISPTFAIEVRQDGFVPGLGLFTSEATEGIYSATHGFDSFGIGVIRISQDVGRIDRNSDMLNFDYRIGWDMLNEGGDPLGKLDRVFSVAIYEPGSYVNLLDRVEVYRLVGGSMNLDTGSLTASLDLTRFRTREIRVSFEAYVPESRTGPAFFQLDNVYLSRATPQAVPEPSAFVLAMLGIGSLAIVPVSRNAGRKIKLPVVE
ncbi:PEP-CTERM sorting domain-containing protein [Aureliella helgolandensis]|uniref:PEP-CTERM protein-sorting domain-containing protein n=1 Tax=Aureliella helgolandensis TaxID=2527968 RepID=A0A518GFH9_9BACT|nr:PEP-CTERM sorting domain-containing protein [Aureliella helgolandensis]QDV27320.1 hypothetical protein Q31a_57080 [Aureliella helgolandensis]